MPGVVQSDPHGACAAVHAALCSQSATTSPAAAMLAPAGAAASTSSSSAATTAARKLLLNIAACEEAAHHGGPLSPPLSSTAAAAAAASAAAAAAGRPTRSSGRSWLLAALALAAAGGLAYYATTQTSAETRQKMRQALPQSVRELPDKVAELTARVTSAGRSASRSRSEEGDGEATPSSEPAAQARALVTSSLMFEGKLSEEDLDFLLDAFDLMAQSPEDDSGKITRGNELCQNLPLSESDIETLAKWIADEDEQVRRIGFTLVSGLIENPEHAAILGPEIVAPTMSMTLTEQNQTILALQIDIIASMSSNAPKLIPVVLSVEKYMNHIINEMLVNIADLPAQLESRFLNMLGCLVLLAPNTKCLLDARLHTRLMNVATATSGDDSDRSKVVATCLVYDLLCRTSWEQDEQILKEDWKVEMIDAAVYHWFVDASDTEKIRLTYLREEVVKTPVSLAFLLLQLVYTHRCTDLMRMFEGLEDDFVFLFMSKVSSITGPHAIRTLDAIANNPDSRLGDVFANSKQFREFFTIRWNDAISMDAMWMSLALPRTDKLLSALHSSYILDFAKKEAPFSTKAWGYLHSTLPPHTSTDPPLIHTLLLAALEPLLDLSPEDHAEPDVSFIRVLTYHLRAYRNPVHARELWTSGLRDILKRCSLDPATRHRLEIGGVVGVLAEIMADGDADMDELVQVHHLPMLIQVHSVLSEVVAMAKAMIEANRQPDRPSEGSTSDMMRVTVDRLETLERLWSTTASELTPKVAAALWKHAKDTIEATFDLSTRILEFFLVDSQGAVFAMVRLGDVLQEWAQQAGRMMRSGPGRNGVNEFARDLELVNGTGAGEFVRVLLETPFRIAAHFVHFEETKHLAIKQLRLLAVNASRFSHEYLTHDTLIVMSKADWSLTQELYELGAMKSPRAMCVETNTATAVSLALQELLLRSAVDQPRLDEIHWAHVTGGVYTGIRGNLLFNAPNVTNSAIASHGVTSRGKYGFTIRTNNTQDIQFGWTTRDSLSTMASALELGSDDFAHMFNPVSQIALHRGSMHVASADMPREGTLFCLLDLDNGTMSVGRAGRPYFKAVFRQLDPTKVWFPCMTIGYAHVAVTDFISSAELPQGYVSIQDALNAGSPWLHHVDSGALAPSPHRMLKTYRSPVRAKGVKGAPVFPHMYYEAEFVPMPGSEFVGVGYQLAGINLLYVLGNKIEMAIHYPDQNPGVGNVWTELVPVLARKILRGLDVPLPTVVNLIENDEEEDGYSIEFKDRTSEGQFILYMAAVTLNKPPSAAGDEEQGATDSSLVAKASMMSEEMRESLKEKTAPSSPAASAISDAPKIDSVLDLDANHGAAAADTLADEVAAVAAEHEVDEVNVVAPSAGGTGSFSHVDHSDEEDQDASQSEVAGDQTESEQVDDAHPKQDQTVDDDAEQESQAQSHHDEEDDASETIKVTPQPSSVSLSSPLKSPCTRLLRVGLGVGADDDGDMVAFLAINNLLRGPHRVSVMKMTDDTMYRPLVLGARNVQLYYGIGKDHKLPLIVGKFMFKEQAKIWGINLDLI